MSLKYVNAQVTRCFVISQLPFSFFQTSFIYEGSFSVLYESSAGPFTLKNNYRGVGIQRSMISVLLTELLLRLIENPWRLPADVAVVEEEMK
jgi:hypothetical protein